MTRRYRTYPQLNALRLRPPYLQDIVYWKLIVYSSNNFLYPNKTKVSKLQIELKPNDVLFCSSLPKNQKYKTNTIRLPNEYEKQNKIIINL